MMSLLKRAVLGILWFLLGRRNLVRFSRYLLNEARLDVPNNMETNGELIVQKQALGLVAKGSSAVVLDVGANIGHWTRALITEAQYTNVEVVVFAFEPCSETRSSLDKNIRDWGYQKSVTILPVALSSETKEAVFYSEGPNAGRNGLYAMFGRDDLKKEIIRCQTLDDFGASRGLSNLNLVKIDTEGHDLEVLRGAQSFLSRKAIDIIQFEYNSRWIDGRFFLRDVFDLLSAHGYRLGKITPRGIEFYPSWDPELETYREANYLAVLPQFVERLPKVDWWKETR